MDLLTGVTTTLEADFKRDFLDRGGVHFGTHGPASALGGRFSSSLGGVSSSLTSSSTTPGRETGSTVPPSGTLMDGSSFTRSLTAEEAKGCVTRWLKL